MRGVGEAMKRQRQQRQAGFTLVELLIGMLVSSLLLGATLNLLSTSLRVWRANNEKLEAQQSGRIAMDFMVRQLKYTDNIYFPASLATKSSSISFQDPAVSNPDASITAATYQPVLFKLGTDAGQNLNTLYQKKSGTALALSTNNIRDLSFTRAVAREVVIEFDVTDSNGSQILGHYKTTVICLNIPQ